MAHPVRANYNSHTLHHTIQYISTNYIAQTVFFAAITNKQFWRFRTKLHREFFVQKAPPGQGGFSLVKGPSSPEMGTLPRPRPPRIPLRLRHAAQTSEERTPRVFHIREGNWERSGWSSNATWRRRTRVNEHSLTPAPRPPLSQGNVAPSHTCLIILKKRTHFWKVKNWGLKGVGAASPP